MLDNLRHLSFHHLKASQLLLQSFLNQRAEYLPNRLAVPLVQQVDTNRVRVEVGTRDNHTALLVQLAKKSVAEKLTLNFLLNLNSKLLEVVSFCFLNLACRCRLFEEEVKTCNETCGWV